MTKDELYLPVDPVAKDWPRLYAQYCRCNDRVIAAMALHRANGADLDLDVLSHHDVAGRMLVRCPVTHHIQVGQKIRVVQNLTNIDQLFPNLSHIIIADVLRLLGVENGEDTLLPALHAVA